MPAILGASKRAPGAGGSYLHPAPAPGAPTTYLRGMRADGTCCWVTVEDGVVPSWFDALKAACPDDTVWEPTADQRSPRPANEGDQR